jgi:hypothetical protein
MAAPPAIRQHTNALKLYAQPVKTEETANSNAHAINNLFRPNLSLKAPERREPAKQPSNAQLFAHPMDSGSLS